MDQVLFVFQETGELVRQVPGLLEHPVAMGLLDDAGYIHLACGIVDSHENHVPREARQRVNFRMKEIDSRQRFPVCPQELRPVGLVGPVRPWGETISLEDIVDGCVTDVVPEILELSFDPPRAPGLVLAGDLDDELLYFFGDPLSAGFMILAAVVFAGNESGVPSENRIWGEDAARISQD